MNNKPYRINLILQEYDNDGFWDIHVHTEITKNKEQLLKSLERTYNLTKTFIETRVE